MSQTKTGGRVLTPCIGVCSTGLGDSVCRGCKRFTHEVIQWNAYSEEERAFIMARIESLLANIVSNYLEVTDATLLRAELERHQVRFSSTADELALAFEALRQFGSHLPDLNAIGCKSLPEQAERPIAELKQAIDTDFYALSEAHYERYFKV